MSKQFLTIIELLIILAVLSAGISACDVRVEDHTARERTQTQLAAAVVDAATRTPAPGETSFKTQPFSGGDAGTRTPPSAATPDGPLVSVSANTNCRVGPGQTYESVGMLERGEQAEVVGYSADWEYWVIKNPDAVGDCWLWAYYATVTGSIEGLPLITPPPTQTPTRTATSTATATPVFVWEGIWSVATGPIDGKPDKEFVMTVTVAGRTFTGIVDFMGNVVTYSGTVSEDLLRVSGTWSDLARGGLFKFTASGENQFQGYYAYGVERSALCGGRSGAGFPSPCYQE